MPTIKGATTSRGWYAFLEYTITGQDIASNKSTISFTLKVHDGTGQSRNEVPNEAYYQMPGRSKTYKTYNFQSAGDYTIASNTVTVSHSNDGTGSYTASALWCSENETAYTPYSLSVSGTITLPTIPRASGLSFQSPMTMGNQANITVDRKSSSFTHTIQYSFGSVSSTIVTKSTLASVPFTPPSALSNQIPNAPSGQGTFTIITYSGNAEIGRKSYTFTLNVPQSMVPTISEVRIERVNSNEWIESKGIYVKGYSKVKVTTTAEGVSGSTVRQVDVTVDGVTYSGTSITSNELQSFGNLTVRVVITDSRGRTATRTSTIQVKDYVPTTIGTLSFARGKYTETGGFIQDNNGADLKATFKCLLSLTEYGNVASGTVDAEGVPSQSVSNVVGTQTVYIVGFGVDAANTVTVSLTDSIGTRTSKSITVPTVTVPINFNMMLPGIGIGKVAERKRTLDIAWDVRIKGRMLLDLLHPIGSIYTSTVSTDPSLLFGGTWERIKDVFLLAAGDEYEAGSEGGSADAVVVSHRHKISNDYGQRWSSTDGGWANFRAGVQSSIADDIYTGYSGEDGAGKNMPPYLAVYVWRRIPDPVPEGYQLFVEARGTSVITADGNIFYVLKEDTP